MHLAVLIVLSLSAIALLTGAIVGVRELRRAPIGVQTARGFYVVNHPAYLVPWVRPHWILWL